jgi:hypothetical protein
MLDKLRSLPRFKLYVLAFAFSFLVYESSAHAVNAIVSQDLPILTEMLATEIEQYAEIATLVAQTATLVSQVKEYATLGKVVWGAIQDLKNLTWADLKKGVLDGLGRAYPELDGMYGDIKDIADLDYADYRARATFRGMLWEHVYGPAIDYLDTASENLDHHADVMDHMIRSAGKIDVTREMVRNWEQQCEEGMGRGENGMCQAATQRAEIQSALMLADLQETSLKLLESQDKALRAQDRKEADQVYQFERWEHDVNKLVRATVSFDDDDCEAGTCLYERYADVVYERIEDYRARHKDDFSKGRGIVLESEANGR